MNITVGFDGQESLDVVELELCRTSGTPVDCFRLLLLYSAAGASAARDCSRVRVYAGGSLVFTGVTDEVNVTVDGNGRWLEVAGRGLAALLMNYEQTGCQFDAAGFSEIKRRLIDPCGIAVEADTGVLATLRRFDISSGVSSWSALCDWAGAAGMVSPRFSADGRLLLNSGGGGLLTLDEGSAVFSAESRRVRSGVIGEVVIRERSTGRQTVVTSDRLKAMGVTGRGAIAAAKGSLEARIPSARWMLEQSRRKFDRFSVELPGGFVCEPGDRISCKLEGFPGAGVADSVKTTFGKRGLRCLVEGYAE